MAKISSTHLFWFFHCPIMCAALMCAGIVVAECFEARGRSLRIITASGGPSSAHGGRRGVAIKASAQDLHQLPGHRQHDDHCNFYNHQLEDLCQVSFISIATVTMMTIVIVNKNHYHCHRYQQQNHCQTFLQRQFSLATDDKDDVNHA